MRYGWIWAALAVVSLALAGCPDKKPKDPLCKGDEDCADGEVCVNQRCQQCDTDEHCPDGHKCRDGACVEVECEADADCPAGKICEENRCVACQSDDQCGPGGRCEQGSCLRPKACKVDEDCEDDEDCIDGVCQRPWEGQRPDGLGCELEPVYFGFDDASVPPEQRDALNATAECLKEAGGQGVYLIGHTDPRGTEEYNVALSERRAQVVADYLARLGIDPARFHVIPKGETEATGANEDGWAQDRRVELDWR